MERVAPQYAALILLLPALGYLINALVGGRLSRTLVGLIACAAVGLSFLVGVAVALATAALPAAERVQRLVLWPWIGAGEFRVDFGLLFDPLSLLMVLIVTGVGFLIHVYAVGYMHDDPGLPRFFAYMNLFVLAMLVLVLADNLLLLMVGWGGVGVCSYLLIAFWFERPEAASAGLKAFVVNAIGDVGLMLASLLLFLHVGALDYATVLERAPQALGAGTQLATLVAFFLLVAAIAKSAQLPLHVWLPDAMAGPTPVSALIHAATMVTAGVYLIVRLHPLFVLAPSILTLAATLGALTAFFAATLGLVQTNIKRVLAYSTVSQLGYMFLAVGLGSFTAGMFHLMTHAFYKALLFLAAGSVIHALGGEEDLRKMGGLRRRLPTTWWAFLIGAIALSGVLPISGFFSKEEIIAAALTGPRSNVVLGWLAILTTLLTALYIFRALFMAFVRPPDAERYVHHAHEAPPIMNVPVRVLLVLAVVGGFVQVPGVTHALETWLEPVFSRTHADVVPPFSGEATVIAWTAAATGLLLAWLWYASAPTIPEAERPPRGLHAALVNGYYVDALYDTMFVRPFRFLSRVLSEGVDRSFFNGAADGIGFLFGLTSQLLRYVQTGYVRSYALAMLLGTVLVLWYLLVR